jgi:hypothetical protein
VSVCKPAPLQTGVGVVKATVGAVTIETTAVPDTVPEQEPEVTLISEYVVLFVGPTLNV